jgi:formate hydrogenlyase subunit 4
MGDDALVLFALLVLARFALALSAWDTGGGFGLMAAARDLAIAASADGLLLAVLTLLALSAGSTSLHVISAGATAAAGHPAHWAAALGFALLVLIETGRLPIDNPDTHLELTMIHEGPLLEYAGRDLAVLQWSAAARHWLLLTLGIAVLIPQPASPGAAVAVLAGGLAAACAGLALVETLTAKLRLLRVPMFIAAGGAVCVLGIISWLAGAGR